jgi:predicted ATPase
VAGYKSHFQEQRIEIRPITILGGANSSGKSSIVQPLLLLKQTLEARFDPGALLLDGPHVRLLSFDEALSTSGERRAASSISVHIEREGGLATALRFQRARSKEVEVASMAWTPGEGRPEWRIWPAMPTAEVRRVVAASGWPAPEGHWVVNRDRCFLRMDLLGGGDGESRASYQAYKGLDSCILKVIHVPSRRGYLERTWPRTSVAATFPGTFDPYTASLIRRWQGSSEDGKTGVLANWLQHLGLTGAVEARDVSDTQIELRVSRLARASRLGSGDFVSLADVGLGVSQVLPVLVALLAAQPDHLVYLEEPEIHLHPQAQWRMARVLAEAARRGVRVVVETHSSLLLRGVQTLVATRRLAPDQVKLHWFKRSSQGTTRVYGGDLDEQGAYGAAWPQDFDAIQRQSALKYLGAVERRSA